MATSRELSHAQSTDTFMEHIDRDKIKLAISHSNFAADPRVLQLLHHGWSHDQSILLPELVSSAFKPCIRQATGELLQLIS